VREGIHPMGIEPLHPPGTKLEDILIRIYFLRTAKVARWGEWRQKYPIYGGPGAMDAKVQRSGG